MLSYNPSMLNTKSAKKAVRSSKKKNQHNLYWKKKIRDAVKNLKKSIDSKESGEVLKDKMIVLQKVLDKSAKEKVIHRNRANRVKSTYAHKISAVSKTGHKARLSGGAAGK